MTDLGDKKQFISLHQGPSKTESLSTFESKFPDKYSICSFSTCLPVLIDVVIKYEIFYLANQVRDLIQSSSSPPHLIEPLTAAHPQKYTMVLTK